MPEALAVVVVAFISVLIFVLARFSLVRVDPAEEVQRSRQHLAWLEERQRHAHAHNWDETMHENLAQQLASARAALAAAEAKLAERPVSPASTSG